MTPIDAHHLWAERRDEDQVYFGKCPDLITGVHGDDQVQVHKKLGEVVQEFIDNSNRRTGPSPRANAADDEGLVGSSKPTEPRQAPGSDGGDLYRLPSPHAAPVVSPTRAIHPLSCCTRTRSASRLGR